MKESEEKPETKPSEEKVNESKVEKLTEEELDSVGGGTAPHLHPTDDTKPEPNGGFWGPWGTPIN